MDDDIATAWRGTRWEKYATHRMAKPSTRVRTAVYTLDIHSPKRGWCIFYSNGNSEAPIHTRRIVRYCRKRLCLPRHESAASDEFPSSFPTEFFSVESAVNKYRFFNWIIKDITHFFIIYYCHPSIVLYFEELEKFLVDFVSHINIEKWEIGRESVKLQRKEHELIILLIWNDRQGVGRIVNFLDKKIQVCPP